MINNLLTLAALLIFAVGAGFFFYPAVSNYFAEKQQMKVIAEYDEEVIKLQKAEIEEQFEQAKAYNNSIANDEMHDPFVQNNHYIVQSQYYDLLDYSDDGVMAYIEIPKIDVQLPIYHGSSEEVLQKGAGHLESSSLPIGGSGTHSVISAHRGLPSAELFSDLDKMEIGDVFYIHILGETHAYEVDQIEVVEPIELSLLRVQEGKDYVTLLTCTPYGENTHRLLVRGKRVPYDVAQEAAAQQVEDAKGLETLIQKNAGNLTILGLGVLILFLTYQSIRKQRKNRR